jgi:hypothetical protein
MNTFDSLFYRLPAGVVAIAGLLGVGVLASGTSFLALLFPNTALAAVWRLNPEAGVALRELGAPGIALMASVCIACAVASIGLMQRRSWGYWTALTILILNVFSDAVTAIARDDLRTLIGVPIGAVLIVYLRRKRIAEIYTDRADRCEH